MSCLDHAAPAATVVPALGSPCELPPRADVEARRADTHALGESIAALAARIHAATHELLVMLREFDERDGWNNGFASCAHWLHWRTGIDLGAARQKVRVARALAQLPRIGAAMRRGDLSYAKVRALTRVATPDNEQALLDAALAGTAAQVERLTRAWRSVDRVEAARLEESRHLSRRLTLYTDDDGMVVIRGRLTPDVGAVVRRALDAAHERLREDARQAASGGVATDDVDWGQRQADALGLLAEVALASDLDAGSAGDRFRVVVHVDGGSAPRAVPPVGLDAPAAVSAAEATGDDVILMDGGVLEVGDTALHVSAETSRRLGCDASLVVMRHGAEGGVLDVGRKTRTIPPAIRRALAARDRQCRFPGCTARRCDAHHLEHWADGGCTSVDNLVLLCRRHHRLVHEGGVRLQADSTGRLTFERPNGARLEAVPATPSEMADLEALVGDVPASSAVWDGTPFDLRWAIDVMYRPRAEQVAATPGR